jgi:hypothetical protein
MSLTEPLSIRQRLVEVALEWEKRFGIAPSITSALSEFDAARLLGCKEPEYSSCLLGQTAVSKGVDFTYKGIKYQVKANRPSGKPGSFVTLVPLAKKDKKENRYLWDSLIWILYNRHYEVMEVWQWDAQNYAEHFQDRTLVRPDDMRKGMPLIEPKTVSSHMPKKVSLVGKAIQTNLDYTPEQRKDILQRFLAGTLKQPYVTYSKRRLYLDREHIEQLKAPVDLLILEINPTPAGIKRGYRPGHVILTYRELLAVFGAHFKTTSWEKYRCFHFVAPPQKMTPFFIEL